MPNDVVRFSEKFIPLVFAHSLEDRISRKNDSLSICAGKEKLVKVKYAFLSKGEIR